MWERECFRDVRERERVPEEAREFLSKEREREFYANKKKEKKIFSSWTILDTNAKYYSMMYFFSKNKAPDVSFFVWFFLLL